ncbi:MAG: hypothetical protein ACXV74_02430 [Methylobacter sp.]
MTGKPPGKDALQNAAQGKGSPPPPPNPGNKGWLPYQQLVLNRSVTPPVPYTYTLGGDPNYCVSQTKLSDKSKLPRDPKKWVDAIKTPYIVLPGNFWPGRNFMGDLATVYNEARGIVVQAILADSGPKNKIGEGSEALRIALKARDQDPITWVVYPHSAGPQGHPAWPVPQTVIDLEGKRRFGDWGGTLRIADNLVDSMQAVLDLLQVGGQIPPALGPLRDSLNSAQAALRASKGTPYPLFSAGPAGRVEILSDRDDALAELEVFIRQVGTAASIPSLAADELLKLAGRARTAIAVPD